jgi:hypothetical protein
VQLSKIFVVARTDFLSDDVRQSWHAAGVDLLGPVSASDLPDPVATDIAGVLLDVSQDASTLFDLSERLIEENIPFLFVVDALAAKSILSPFVVDDMAVNRQAIFEALARVGHEQTVQ